VLRSGSIRYVAGNVRGQFVGEVCHKGGRPQFTAALAFRIGESVSTGFDARWSLNKKGRPKPPNHRRPEATTLALPDNRSSRGWCRSLAFADELGTCGKT
jgi:hypothetical protein